MARMLLIEDNENNSYLLSFILQKAGHTVVAAGDGLSGIAAAECQPPDLILLDMQLPGMSGYEVAAELRRRPTLAGVPIVAVTSNAMAGDRERVLSAGCDGYLEKPIDPDSFVETVISYLPEHKRQAEGGSHELDPDRGRQ